MDKVSVYITTHNRLERLKRAIKSVEKQTYQNTEILVCDDASNDGTKEYMMNLVSKNNKFKYFRNEENKGACFTRNLGIFGATGKFITGLDDDDEFTEDRISSFINSWNDKYSFICADFIEKYTDGKSKKYYNFNSDKIINSNKLLIENLASNQIFTLSSRMKEIGGFNKDVKRLQDWDTWLRLGRAYGDFLRLSKPTYIMYHDHGKLEARVSKSYPLKNALVDLKNNNNGLYDKKSLSIINYLINYEAGSSTLLQSIKVSIISKNPKYFFKQILKKKNND